MSRARPPVVLLLLLCCPPALAQTVRLSGTAQVRYIELRPLVSDSVAADLTSGAGLLRQTADGRVVRCLPDDPFCRDVHPGARTSTVPFIQDLEISAWGFGRGTHAFAQLRGRSALRGSEMWPQAEDALDVLAAYAELTRPRWRVRAGRQWKISGLGFYNFDGLAVEVQPLRAASLEAYGGRSLLRGLNEPRSGGALEAIETLAPPAGGVLMGLHARYQPSRTTAFGAVYQIDFRNDGGGLFSELFAADAMVRAGRFDAEAALEVDVASAAINEARLRIRAPAIGRFVPFAELRRYRPYFELWTIWGAFSPVGYDEARAGVSWADASSRWIVQSEASHRSYDASEAESSLDDISETGWGAALNATWLPAMQWRVSGGYRIEGGFGAARREANVGVAHELTERASAAVQAVVFERLYEFRLDEGTVVGIGAEGGLRVSERLRLTASGASYWHLRSGQPAASDWNQRRGSLRVQWMVGPEPGMAQP